ncbi:MAG: VWA domain-containing protein [Clostridiales bacterium]|nr:VWA domain-containing protein [Clostridiales bacterium]
MKRIKMRLCMVSVFIVCIVVYCILYYSVPTYARETSEKEDQTLAPYFLVDNGDPSMDAFPLKETNVSTTINGIIAETYVTQTYTNEGTNPINGKYVFPASTNAAVHGMTMQIGDQIITAKIKEKEEARQEFETAKEEGKSASLMEQKRPNIFTMDVANIMPGDTIRIELHYTELISPTDSTYQYVFPTVVGPRYTSLVKGKDDEPDKWVETPYFKENDKNVGKYNISVRLSTGVPITELSCRSHKINTAYDNESTAQITLADPQDYAGNRDFILDYKLTGDEIHSGLTLSTGEDENFFLMTVQPPERYEPEDIPPREYIFVLDTSGSMSGYPLDTAKDLIRDLVSNLKETDRFNLVVFSDMSIRLSSNPLPATRDNIKRAIKLIDSQEGCGGTEFAPALKEAVSLPRTENYSRSVITITDGYISGEEEVFDIVQNNLDTTNFFSFGIGESVNRYLIDGIAKSGSGEAFVVTDSREAGDTADKFRSYIQAPLLTDIRISYDGFEVYDLESTAPSTLFAEKPIVLFGKWKGGQTGTIRITGKTGTKDFVQEIPVSDAQVLEGDKTLGYLWARTRVERLTTYDPYENENATKREVTALGMKYSMMTPYTSFIAVTETVRNANGDSTDVKQPLPLPAGVSELAVGGYTVGSEPSEILLFSILFLLFAARAVYRRKKYGITTQ